MADKLTPAPIIKPFAVNAERHGKNRFSVVEIVKETAKTHDIIGGWRGHSRPTRVVSPSSEYPARFDTKEEAEAAAARGNRKWKAHQPLVEAAKAAFVAAGARQAEEAIAALTSEEIAECPACFVDFQPDDICAIDVDLGICHAACLAGSPVVDLDTGADLPEGAKVLTFRYGDDVRNEEITA